MMSFTTYLWDALVFYEQKSERMLNEEHKVKGSKRRHVDLYLKCIEKKTCNRL
jgi:hypothetical protein